LSMRLENKLERSSFDAFTRGDAVTCRLKSTRFWEAYWT